MSQTKQSKYVLNNLYKKVEMCGPFLFMSLTQKLGEKLVLFVNTNYLIGNTW